jgi:uncharacterized membrane protein YeaQ/YmgE (transglycosylase-associated protein family)
MSILWTIIIGLIVGALAKFVMPGKDPGGIIITILLGIVGAFVGTFIGRALGLYSQGQPRDGSCRSSAQSSSWPSIGQSQDGGRSCNRSTALVAVSWYWLLQRDTLGCYVVIPRSRSRRGILLASPVACHEYRKRDPSSSARLQRARGSSDDSRGSSPCSNQCQLTANSVYFFRPTAPSPRRRSL